MSATGKKTKAKTQKKPPPEKPPARGNEADPALENEPLLRLQGLIGNRALGQMLDDEHGSPSAASSNPLPALSSGLSPSLRSWITRGGARLPGSTQGLLEDRLGADLSAVRVHTGAESNAAARALGADAFALGPHIHFADGLFDPAGSSGLSLLTHEVAHTLQPSLGRTTSALTLGASASSEERVAEEVSAAWRSGPTPATRGRAAGGDDGVIRRHVTHNQRQGAIGGQEAFLTRRGAAGRYLFTRRGGWLDRTHLLGHDRQAIDVMDRLASGARTVPITSDSAGGPYTTIYEIDHSSIPAPAADERLEELTIALMMDHDRRFESFQRYHLGNLIAQTPFSYEDLPSDRVGVEVGLRYRRLFRQQAGEGASPVEGLNRRGHPNYRRRQRVLRQVLQELEPVSGSQGLAQYNAFLRNQGRGNVDPAGGLLQIPDDYLHSSPQNHSFAPIVDPALSPVRNPVPWLNDSPAAWTRLAFRYVGQDHESTILALSELIDALRGGIETFVQRLLFIARAQLNPINWDSSASGLSPEGQAAVIQAGTAVWSAANRRTGRPDASSIDDFLTRLGRRLGDTLPPRELRALAGHIAAAHPTLGSAAEVRAELQALTVVALPNWLHEHGLIRYRVDPEGLTEFMLHGTEGN